MRSKFYIIFALILLLFPNYAKTTPPVVDADLKALAAKTAKDRGLQSDEAFCVKVRFE